jgi:hypothetical protein
VKRLKTKLFTGKEPLNIEFLGDIERLRLAFEGMDDEPLMRVLEKKRGKRIRCSRPWRGSCTNGCRGLGKIWRAERDAEYSKKEYHFTDKDGDEGESG